MVTSRLAALSVALLLAVPAIGAEPGPIVLSKDPSPALSIAQKLMTAERELPVPAEDISLGLVNLDNDGVDEIFAFAENPYFCGSAGCIPRIYRLEGAYWQEIRIEGEAMLNSELTAWAIAPGEANGWAILQLTHPDYTLTYEWDGAAYTQVTR